MNLYTNGCSFVLGDELDDRENEAFPYLLQKRLNCELINDAQRGSNNQRILRTTLNTNLDNQFVMVGWSSIYRYEYYHEEWIGINPSDGEKFKKLNKRLSNSVHWFKEDWFYVNFLNQVLALQNHLKYHNIPFFFFLSFDIINRLDYVDYFDLIDEETFPSLFNSDLDFRSYCLKNGQEMTSGFDGHPTKESHKLWADYLYENSNITE